MYHGRLQFVVCCQTISVSQLIIRVQKAQAVRLTEISNFLTMFKSFAVALIPALAQASWGGAGNYGGSYGTYQGSYGGVGAPYSYGTSTGYGVATGAA